MGRRYVWVLAGFVASCAAAGGALALLGSGSVPVVFASLGGGRFVPMPGEFINFDSQLAGGAYDRKRQQLLATDGNHGTVNVFDLKKREVARIVDVGGEPHAIGIHPDGKRAFVADR